MKRSTKAGKGSGGPLAKYDGLKGPQLFNPLRGWGKLWFFRTRGSQPLAIYIKPCGFYRLSPDQSEKPGNHLFKHKISDSRDFTFWLSVPLTIATKAPFCLKKPQILLLYACFGLPGSSLSIQSCRFP
jgi:hypothetical protein